jgi:Lon protease-like protein
LLTGDTDTDIIPQEIQIPRNIPAMTLNQTVLFPQTMMPLFIFDPRYRELLSHVLKKDQIFAVASPTPKIASGPLKWSQSTFS